MIILPSIQDIHNGEVRTPQGTTIHPILHKVFTLHPDSYHQAAKWLEELFQYHRWNPTLAMCMKESPYGPIWNALFPKLIRSFFTKPDSFTDSVFEPKDLAVWARYDVLESFQFYLSSPQVKERWETVKISATRNWVDYFVTDNVWDYVLDYYPEIEAHQCTLLEQARALRLKPAKVLQHFNLVWPCCIQVAFFYVEHSFDPNARHIPVDVQWLLLQQGTWDYFVAQAWMRELGYEWRELENMSSLSENLVAQHYIRMLITMIGQKELVHLFLNHQFHLLQVDHAEELCLPAQIMVDDSTL